MATWVDATEEEMQWVRSNQSKTSKKLLTTKDAEAILKRRAETAAAAMDPNSEAIKETVQRTDMRMAHMEIKLMEIEKKLDLIIKKLK